MATSDIIIVPQRGSSNPIIQFSGSTGAGIYLEVVPTGSVMFMGRAGSLFGITDGLSGSLMSVNDISGLPILEVFSDDRVVMGQYNTNALVVTGSNTGVGTAAPAQKLHVVGNVVATGTITANYSDARLKKDLKIITQDEVWKVVNGLQGYTFRWNENVLQLDESMSAKYNVLDTGLIAQEVGAVWPFGMVDQPPANPEMVTYHTIAYDKLVPILLNAIKSLKQEVDELKSEVSKLKGV